MAYITDNELKTYLAAHLKAAGVSSLPAHWDVLVPIANTAAYNEIRRRLLGRGFTTAQIDAWDERVFFSYSLSVCHLLKHAASGDTPDTWQKKFCIVDQLDTVDIMVSGALVEPDAGASDFGHGSITVDSSYPWETSV